MRLNARTCVRTERLLLVPYEPHHVPRYHAWMLSEELRALTASELLTLEEEYAMQRSWREDQDKLTFILLDRDLFEAAQGPKQDREVASMVGDVNLFLQESCAELEIMLAEPSARGRGLGREAALAMMAFAVDHGALPPSVESFSAKIGLDNAPSLRLFDRLGFREIARSVVFKEVTLTLPLSELTRELPLSVLTCDEVK